MHLATKGRFAVTALLDVALRPQPGPVKLADISERQKISLSYLELLFARLARRQIARGTRGPGGGYSLAREPAEITVADVILAVDDDVRGKRRRADDVPGCEASNGCELDGVLWASLNARLLQCLSTITLQDLVDDQLARGTELEAAPSIRRAISKHPVLQPIRVTGPNSVFALAETLA